MILQDYEIGTLSLAEAARYAIDSISSPEKLPSRYADAPPAHATHALTWLYGNYDALDVDLQQVLEQTGSHTCSSFTVGTTTITGLTLFSSNSLFMVHYTTSGTHATTTAYVSAVLAAATTAYFTMVGTLGYLEPPRDTLTCSGLTNRWHIYIFTTTAFNGVAVSHPTTYCEAGTTTSAIDTCGAIGIRNGLSSGAPTQQLQQVVSHEFTHVIQFGYRTVAFSGTISAGWLFESHAVYGQHVTYHTGTYATTTRFSQCLNPAGTSKLDQGLFSTLGSIEYECGGLWWEYVSLQFGHLFVRQVWENLLTYPATYWASVPFSTSDIASAIIRAFLNHLPNVSVSTTLQLWVRNWAIANIALQTAGSGFPARYLFGYTTEGGSPHVSLPKAKLETTLNFAGTTITWTSNVNGDGVLRGLGADYVKVTESSTIASTKITLTCTSNCPPFTVLFFTRSGI